MSAFEDHHRGIISSLGGVQTDHDQINTRFALIKRRLDIVEA